MAQKKTSALPKQFGDKDAAVAEFLKLLAELIAREWLRRTLQNANEPKKRRCAGTKAAKKPGSPPDIPD